MKYLCTYSETKSWSREITAPNQEIAEQILLASVYEGKLSLNDFSLSETEDVEIEPLTIEPLPSEPRKNG